MSEKNKVCKIWKMQWFRKNIGYENNFQVKKIYSYIRSRSKNCDRKKCVLKTKGGGGEVSEDQ